MRDLFQKTLLVLLLWGFSASAGQAQVSGDKLFNSTSLGTNGKSCATCHLQGQGLESIGDYDDAILAEIVNFCIRDAMKGEMLAEDSDELAALAGYIRRFQKK